MHNLIALPYWKFSALRNKFGEIFAYDRKHKIIIANLKYSPEIGLIDDIEDLTEII